MADPHLNLIERLPEDEKQVRQPTECNPASDTMAHEFDRVRDEHGSAAAKAGDAFDMAELRRCRAALQDKVLLLLRQITRI